MPTKNMFDIMKELEDLRKERQFLVAELEFQKCRNKELRQKSYINVYDENLKLLDENKALKHENKVKYNDLVKYEKAIIELKETLKVREDQLRQSAEISDGFYTQMIETEKENRHLNNVIKSVGVFLDQQSGGKN